MKFSLISALIILINLPSQAQIDTVLYSFFVAGHTYGAPGVNNIGFHPPFKELFWYIQGRPEIEFGILTGDIVSSFPIAQDWDEIDADIDTLGLPVYFAVGNHDMENRSLFESRYGNTYYSFTYKDDLFIVLDPNIDAWSISGLQLQFLHDLIDNNAPKSDNIYVFFHQILWKEADNQFNYIFWNSDAGRGSLVNFWTEIEPIFRNLSNETIMFAGDLGAAWSTDGTYDSYDNITLISSGMGDSDGENFIIVNVDTNKLVSYDLICLSDTNLNCMGALTDYLVVSELTSPTNSVGEPLYIYPNPIIDYITIHQELTRKTTFKLFDLLGKLILIEELEERYKNTINVTHIPSGVYIATLFDELNKSTVKLIIE